MLELYWRKWAHSSHKDISFCYDCINIVKQKSVDNDLSTMMFSTMTQPTLYRNIINALIVSTQNYVIDLSQLSPSPTRNVNIQPRITPKRLFNSVNPSTDDAKHVSLQCDNTDLLAYFSIKIVRFGSFNFCHMCILVKDYGNSLWSYYNNAILG